jgi:creatinine amidohydrolase/Fe(II)-dependent formamide hydrolase-like protein
MKGTMRLTLTLVVVLVVGSIPAMAQRLDMNTFPNPIEALDTVWIEDLTMVEVRDYIKEGKTNALILTGGIEQNGPYLVTGKHNYVLRAMGESIAREMGNTLVVPIVTLEPGNPEGENVSPGTVYLSGETYRAVLKDIANSLKSQGFTNIFVMGDSGGNQTPMGEVAEELTANWGSGPAQIHFIPEYYQNRAMRTFIQEELGIEEVSEGLHDEYFIAVTMMAADLNSVRTDQRIRAGKFSINGVSLLPIEKTLANARKIIGYRTELTVNAMRKAMGTGASNRR